MQASINIDMDTLSEDIDQRARIIKVDALRAVTYRDVVPRFVDLLDRHFGAPSLPTLIKFVVRQQFRRLG